ncbi:keratin, type II cytoskeletal 80 [Physeter macrocephalus]|uniref:Keratin, type II cytoskeletal 80 n=1 Tax=Physeter macrocephalus TaxID=9755 RepID=A0A455BEY7_PHYMC|nr:keratin, type II cytoskeletal 80 [Physeter catodon]XP_054939424.1 keratin, type II cytoskeletal 80 [Physeter catodon]XP_054939425.1 keratin, type II cytoskeletal 80 [Physeter catodon]|eukprot:XP_028342521.1 keratin, type II cytoskeletal 80 [Physeter catodon]
MACRSCIVGSGNLNSCVVTQASSPWPGTSGWSNYRAPELGFSSSSLTGCLTASTIPKVTVNPSLLVPLDLKVDPAIQQQKSQKKEEMKVLNDKFATLIGKVQALEQRNQLLETRWRFLQSRDSAAFDLGHLYEEYQGRLQEELRKVNQEGAQLEAKLLQQLEMVKEFQIRYEDEISKRTDMEFTSVQLKKDLEAECLRRTELETKLKCLKSFVVLMKSIYEQVRRWGQGPAEPWVRDAGEAKVSSGSWKLQQALIIAAVNNPTCPLVTHFMECGRFPQSLSQGEPCLHVCWSAEGMQGTRYIKGQEVASEQGTRRP